MGFFTFTTQNARWLGAGVMLTFLSGFGQTFFLSIFSEKIRSEFGLGHGQWGSLYAVATATSAGVMIWAGGLADRFKVRVLSLIIGILFALSALTFAFAPSVMVLGVAIFGLRFSGQGMYSHIASVAMARWFVASRGRALAIAHLGFSIAEASLPFIFVILLSFFHWQSIWAFNAVLILLSIPLLMRLLQQERAPRPQQDQEDQVGMDGRHWDRRAALGSPLFWAVALCVGGLSAFGTAFFFHQVHFAATKGWSHLSFVALLPVYTVSTVVFMMIFGWLLDKYGTGRIMPMVLLPSTLGFALFSIGESLWSAAGGFFFMGITAGAVATAVTAFWAEFFGTKHIGAIKSMAAAFMVLGSAIGPGVTGYFIDLGVSLSAQFQVICLLFLAISAFLFITVRRALPRSVRL